MNVEQVQEARDRVIARMTAAAAHEHPDTGRTIQGDALLLTFAGTDLPAEEMLEQVRRECMGVLLRGVQGVPVQELIMGLALRELLLGFELGVAFAREQAGGGRCLPVC